MFNGCSSLKTAPELQATTLADLCYYMMFYGCTNLTSVTMLASSDQISGNRCKYWLEGAGTKEGISRTLKVKDEAAYKALVDNEYLPTDYWQKGKCTVQDESGNAIEQNCKHSLWCASMRHEVYPAIQQEEGVS